MANKQKIDLLQQLERDLVDRPKWHAFGAYCRTRNSGLRSEAMKFLDEFIRETISWDFSDRKEFICWLLSAEEQVGTENFDQRCIPQPLSDRLVEPTLRQWSTQETADSRVFRWLGKWYGKELEPNDLRRALQIDPNDQLARFALIRSIGLQLWNRTERIFDGYYNDDPANFALVAEAYNLIDGLNDPPKKEQLRQAITDRKNVIEDFLRFKAESNGTFEEWCTTRGRQYSTEHPFYYL